MEKIWIDAQVVDNEYRQLHPDEVEEVHVLNDTAHLEKLVKEYQKLQRSLEDLIDDFTSKKRRNKKIKPKLVRLLQPVFVPPANLAWSLQVLLLTACALSFQFASPQFCRHQGRFLKAESGWPAMHEPRARCSEPALTDPDCAAQ